MPDSADRRLAGHSDRLRALEITITMHTEQISGHERQINEITVSGASNQAEVVKEVRAVANRVAELTAAQNMSKGSTGTLKVVIPLMLTMFGLFLAVLTVFTA